MSSNSAESVVLDDLDAQIITLLQDDGRRPTVKMARQLAVAEGTVRKRIERLVREKVIQIGAWADPLKIGYQNYAVLMMHVDLRDLERAAEQLSKMPEIFFLGTCTGGFDLFVSACFRSLEHMHEFMTKRLSRVPGIQRVSTSHVTRVMKRDYSFRVTAVQRESPAGLRRVRPRRRPRLARESRRRSRGGPKVARSS
jgi:Lrp/AsnC family transcriptional regulator for asnA, asnC and gidA